MADAPFENVVDEDAVNAVLALFPGAPVTWLRRESKHGAQVLINFIVDNPDKFPSKHEAENKPNVEKAKAAKHIEDAHRVPVALEDDAKVDKDNNMIIEALQSLLQVEMDSLELTSVERSMLFEMCEKVFSKVKTRVIRVVTNNADVHPLHAMVVLALASRGLEKTFLERQCCLPPELLVELYSMKPLVMETNRKFKEGGHNVALSDNLNSCWQTFKNVIDVQKEMFESTNFKCLVCMSVYEPRDGLGCTDLTGFSMDFETHRMCLDCIRGMARAASEEAPVARGGQGLPCPQAGCPQVFLISRVMKFLSADDSRRLDTRINAEALSDFDNEMERCKNCSFAALIYGEWEKFPTFLCPECKANFCRKCKLDWTAAHNGRSCDELVSDKDKARRKLEEELTDAVLRKCTCGLSFQKEDGCNKMTCRCGKIWCYLCRAQIQGYSHFTQKGEAGKCPLWLGEEKEDLRRLKLVRDDARGNILIADAVDAL